MVTNEQYLQIVQKLSSAPCPHNDLNKLKEKYAIHVASTRSMERCNTLCELIRLLEKRCLINEDDIMILKEIALELKREELIYDIIQSVSRTPQIIQGSELNNRIFLLWSTLLVLFDYSVCWLYFVVSGYLQNCYNFYRINITFKIHVYVEKCTVQLIAQLNHDVINFRFVHIVNLFILLCLSFHNLIVYVIKLFVFGLVYLIGLYLLPLFCFLYVKYKVCVSQARNHIQANQHLFLN